MGNSSTAGRNFRLLTVALRKCTPPLEPAMLAALPGFDWIGDAPDCNEGLRLTLMIRPDVIIVPACEAAPKLLPVPAILNLKHFEYHGLS